MQWEHHKNDFIVDGDALFGSGTRTEDSKIAKSGDYYYMATCNGIDGNHMNVYMLKSKSIYGPWEKVQNEPIIKRGKFYDFDFKYLRLGGITFDSGTWFIYYSGQNLLRQDAVGLATTTEKEFPFGWKKYKKNPILKRAGNGWESSSILTLSMKKIGPNGKEWFGHYTGKGKNRRYHMGICYADNPYGPFTRFEKNPMLGAGDWDANGPARCDFIKTENKIYGTYESAKAGPVFQIGGYWSDSLEGKHEKIFPDKPFLSGLPDLQYANPCLWYENGKVYLFVGKKVSSDHTPYWRYIDVFTLIQ